MVQASGKRAAPPRPKRIDPAGPVEPLDIPDIGDIPVGGSTRIGIEGGDAVISTEVGGSRIDLRLPIEDRAPGRSEAQNSDTQYLMGNTFVRLSFKKNKNINSRT